jgi:mono/diheme cytochrome c family protein
MKNSYSKNLILIPFILLIISAGISSISGYNKPESENNYQTNKWIAPKDADKVVNPLKGNAVETAKGKGLFNTQCATCHGDQGKGDGPGGLQLHPHPGNLSSEEVQKQPDGAIFWKITNGRPPMASYKYTFSDKQRWELVNYIREFHKKK